jgi:ABC-2 type transport system permease protein
MKSFRTVFSFTLRDAMRKKFFIISTIFGLVLILVLCALPMILDKTDDSTDTPGMGGDPGTPTEVSKTGTIYFLTKGDFPNGVAAMEQAFPTDEIIPITENELEQSIEMAATSDKTAVIVLNMENGLPMVTAHIKSFFDDSVASYAAKAIQRQWTTDLLAAEGVSEEVALQVANDVPYVVNLVGKMDLSGYIIGILILCIMFFAIYYYGYGVAMSVATEKTSRVMETLLVAARPRELFWGKCLAMGVLGLAQLSLFLGFGALCYHFLVPEDFLIMGMPLSLRLYSISVLHYGTRLKLRDIKKKS